MIASRDIKNMVVKNRVEKLEKENKQLKKELELVRKNTRANIETLDLMYGENVDLKKENEELQTENEKLKADLGECECSFGFENDEVGYRKREYKRLKKWIKDHCKGYGNLFPEDEMKRQWKKADKKRKKAKEDDELIYEEGLYD